MSVIQIMALRGDDTTDATGSGADVVRVNIRCVARH